ncbi:MAG: hypothetical protein HY673_19885 [Chloroflexi bacterium]|nr:hypothetical protein [Chloroflexota bacterium]
MTQVRQLFDLQELDLAITLHQAEIQKLRGQLTETEELLRARKELEEKGKSLIERQKAQRDLETEIDDLRVKVKSLQQKLAGGTIKNPRELVNLQTDLDQQKAGVSKKEDAALELMAELEKLQEETGRKKGEVQRLEQSWKESRAVALDHLKSEDAHLAGLEQKKQELVGKLDPASVRLYDSLKARKGRPLARVEQGMCMGCRVTLPMSLIQRARSSTTEAVFCCNCERILLVG